MMPGLRSWKLLSTPWRNQVRVGSVGAGRLAVGAAATKREQEGA